MKAGDIVKVWWDLEDDFEFLTYSIENIDSNTLRIACGDYNWSDDLVLDGLEVGNFSSSFNGAGAVNVDDYIQIWVNNEHNNYPY